MVSSGAALSLASMCVQTSLAMILVLTAAVVAVFFMVSAADADRGSLFPDQC